jgi:hypothetical protein
MLKNTMIGYMFSYKKKSSEIVPYECAVCFTKNQEKLISPQCCKYRQVYCLDCLQIYTTHLQNLNGVSIGNCMTCNSSTSFIRKYNLSTTYYLKLISFFILSAIIGAISAIFVLSLFRYVMIFNSVEDILTQFMNMLIFLGFLAELYFVASAFIKHSLNIHSNVYVDELKQFAFYVVSTILTSVIYHNSNFIIIAPVCNNISNYTKCLTANNETHFSENCYNSSGISSSYLQFPVTSIISSVNYYPYNTNILKLICMFYSIFLMTLRNLIIMLFTLRCIQTTYTVFLTGPIRSLNPIIIILEGLSKMFDHYNKKYTNSLDIYATQSAIIYPIKYKTVKELPKQYTDTVQPSYPIDT